MSSCDDHGQPLNRHFSSRRLTHRTIDELIGLCKGIMADGIIHPDEARFLASWLDRSREIIDVWPANILAARIEKILEDDFVDENEQKELFDLLTELTGSNPSRELIDKNTGEIIDTLTHAATMLPLDKPAPTLTFENKIFCLTGRFFYGPRKKLTDEIKARGGETHATTTRKTDYLVIGLLGSTDWQHSTHGNKIATAVSYREKGCLIKIVSEEHWVTFL